VASEGIFSEPLFVAFVTVCLTSIPVAFVAAWRFARRAGRSLDKFDVNVEPHFAAPKPGEVDQSIPARMGRVDYELSFNHGASVKDVLRRVDLAVERIDGSVVEHGRRLTALESHRLHEGP